MAIESLILFGLFVGSPQKPKKQVEPGDTEREEAEKRKQEQAQGVVRGAKGAYKGQKLAKKFNFGKKGQMGMAAAGGLGGRMLGRRKGVKKEETREEEGKVKERSRINRAGREASKELAKEGVKMGIERLGALGGPIGIVVAKAVIHYRITLGIIIVLIVFFFMLFDANHTLDEPQSGNPLQIQKQGPTTAKEGDTLPYIISVSYPGSADNAVVTDQLPPGTSFICSTVGTANPCTAGNSLGKYDKATNTVTWDAKQLSIPLNDSINFSVFVLLKATKDNSNVINYAQVTLTNGSLSGNGGTAVSEQGYVAPNTDNCNGKYASQIASNYLLHKNFGDPQCNFNKDQAYTALKQQDPQDASIFFTIIVPCESSWVPNTWASPATGTPNGQGAWGLFQMGDSRPPGQPANANSINDRGDVNWQLQIVSATKKAIQEHHVLNSAQGGYWSSDDWKRC